MLPDDAFLRRLPATLNPAQAIRLEALMFSADVVESNLAATRAIANHFREKIGAAPRNVRVDLITRAWTIVDSLHVIIQILRATKFPSNKIREFISKYQSTRTLRNHMDHLTQNAANVASSKNRPPVFGVLGYVCVPDSLLEVNDGKVTVRGGGMVAVSSGRFVGEKKLRLVNPSGRTLPIPVGGFELQAFGQFLDLEQAESDLRELLVELNKTLEAEYLSFAKAKSRETGMTIDQIMSPVLADLVIYFSFGEGSDLARSVPPDMADRKNIVITIPSVGR
jgi:hypothetical protein